MTPDHPHVRASVTCPCCGSFKRLRKIACDDCWWDFWQQGTEAEREAAEAKLDAAEDTYERAEELEYAP